MTMLTDKQVFYFAPYFMNPFKLNRFPAPNVAALTNLWALWQARYVASHALHWPHYHPFQNYIQESETTQISELKRIDKTIAEFKARKHTFSVHLHTLHSTHGDFVRLAPNHVSIAHPDSIRDVMGHGNGFLKSDFYYAFDNIEDNIFTTRDREKHGRKRKYVAHMFSPKAMVGFEPYITSALRTLGQQMERLITSGKAGAYVSLDQTDSKISARKAKGEAALDVAMWSAFLAFDIIGDLVSFPFFFFPLFGSDEWTDGS
jgi:hypothetical protein